MILNLIKSLININHRKSTWHPNSSLVSHNLLNLAPRDSWTFHYAKNAISTTSNVLIVFNNSKTVRAAPHQVGCRKTHTSPTAPKIKSPSVLSTALPFLSSPCSMDNKGLFQQSFPQFIPVTQPSTLAGIACEHTIWTGQGNSNT